MKRAKVECHYCRRASARTAAAVSENPYCALCLRSRIDLATSGKRVVRVEVDDYVQFQLVDE